MGTEALGVVASSRRRESEVREEAEDHFLTAHRAVDDDLMSVSENTLLKQQDSIDIRSFRQKLLDTAFS